MGRGIRCYRDIGGYNSGGEGGFKKELASEVGWEGRGGFPRGAAGRGEGIPYRGRNKGTAGTMRGV